jgi:hypothetical protein
MEVITLLIQVEQISKLKRNRIRKNLKKYLLSLIVV